MILSDKRLLGGVAAAVLVAAAGGFTVARWTADTPAAPAPEGGKSEAAEAEAAPSDTLPMSAEMMKRTGVTTETVNPGGLAAEIVAQATVAPSPTGEAIVTARAGGAVTRVFKRLGDPVRRGEALAIVESRDAAQIAADRTAAAAKATLAQRNLARERYLYGQKVSPRVDLETAQAEADQRRPRRGVRASRQERPMSPATGAASSSPLQSRDA